MIAIYKRELRAYFTSMQAYIYLALFVGFTGVYFAILNIANGYNDFSSYVLSNFSYMIFAYAISVPILTMRMFSEEKKHKTDQLLLTAPVSVWEIVLGKFLACATVFFAGMLIISVFPVIIALNGSIPVANTVSGYIGMILFAMCIISIGTLISSLTEEPVIAVIVTAVATLFILFFKMLVSLLPNGVIPTFLFFGLVVIALAVLFYIDTRKPQIAAIVMLLGGGLVTGLYFWQKEWFVYGLINSLNWLSIETRYEEFLNGIVNLSSVVYLLTVIAVCLFLTTRVIEKRRWK